MRMLAPCLVGQLTASMSWSRSLKMGKLSRCSLMGRNVIEAKGWSLAQRLSFPLWHLIAAQPNTAQLLFQIKAPFSPMITGYQASSAHTANLGASIMKQPDPEAMAPQYRQVASLQVAAIVHNDRPKSTKGLHACIHMSLLVPAGKQYLSEYVIREALQGFPNVLSSFDDCTFCRTPGDRRAYLGKMALACFRQRDPPRAETGPWG